MNYSKPTKEDRGSSPKIDHGKQTPILATKLQAGSVDGKTCIALSDGKTVIYVHPSKDPLEVRRNY
jgi:hypothetical protein